MSIKKAIVAILALLVAVLAIWTYTNHYIFRIVDITPQNKSTIPTSTSVIRISFNKKLKDGTYDRSLVNDPGTVVRELTLENNQIFIRLFELSPGNEYHFSLADIYSADGKKIPGPVFRFKAVYVPFEGLSRAQQELELQETDRNNKEDPLLKYLPHSTLEYTLEGLHDTDHEGEYSFVIDAKIFLSNADSANQVEVVNRIKSDISNYIKSVGFDLKDYVVRYNIVQPSL